MRLSPKAITAAGAILVAGGVQAGTETATKLRLQSIEARLPDVERLASLEQRVQRLAQADTGSRVSSSGTSSAGGGNLFAILQDVQALQEDVRNLRGQIEQIQFELRQREQRQRDLYQDLDGRLAAIEQRLGISSNSAGGSTGDSSSSSSPSPSGGSDEGAESAYQAAFDKLKSGDYDKAGKAFSAFLERYPDSQYSDNAWYWLGESHYVDREYEPAMRAMQRVVNDFRGSPKVPDALYKIGVIQDERGDYQAARKSLEQVVNRHADSKAAELARKRLDAIDKANGQ